jgi:hypothetical protein
MSKGVSELEVASAPLSPATLTQPSTKTSTWEVWPGKVDVAHLENTSAIQMISEEMRARMLEEMRARMF